MREKLVVALLVVAFVMAPTVPMTEGVQTEKPLVIATIAPIASIVQEAFPQVRVVVLIPPGVDPHEYQMTAKQVELVQKASVIVTTGGHLPVERRILELRNSGEIEARVLLVQDYFKYGFRYLKESWYNNKDNPHGVWLDPYNAIAIAEATEKALIQSDPSRRTEYTITFERFRARVLGIVDSYRALIRSNGTAIVQMPPDQYALEWLGLRVVDSLKPEEEIPSKGIDELLPESKTADVLVYGLDSPEQMKNAMKELAAKSGKPLAGITVFWSSGNYTEWLVKNTATIIRTINSGECPSLKECPEEGETTERYVFLSLLTGIVLGTAIGVVLKR